MHHVPSSSASELSLSVIVPTCPVVSTGVPAQQSGPTREAHSASSDSTTSAADRRSRTFLSASPIGDGTPEANGTAEAHRPGPCKQIDVLFSLLNLDTLKNHI
jgi:hypothetical protein